MEDQSALSESVVLCPVPNTIPLANWVCLIGQIGPESGDPEGILLLGLKWSANFQEAGLEASITPSGTE
ncbi:MAG: hypothetical protein QOF56_124 [Acidobacteriaceae bacterium]|nr:hypothetical protein [Acidobacteriaceae bacterium]